MFEEFGSGVVYSTPVSGNKVTQWMRLKMWYRSHFAKMPKIPDSPVVVIDKDGARGIPEKHPGWPGGRQITPVDLEKLLDLTGPQAYISQRCPGERTITIDGDVDLVRLAAEINCFFSRVEL